MKEVFTGFKNQWTKWAAIGLITILASMAYVHLAREWSAFRVLLIAVVGLTLGLVESHIPGPSHIFNWVNASRLLGAALIIFLLASFVPNRTKAATEWIKENIDKPSTPPPTAAIAPSASPKIPICQGATEVRATYDAPVKVALQEGCWSGLIRIPARSRLIVENDLAEWYEYRFLDGSIHRVDEAAGEMWFPDIPKLAFRLRGTEVATISVESNR